MCADQVDKPPIHGFRDLLRVRPGDGANRPAKLL
jgi:hypothetical protein